MTHSTSLPKSQTSTAHTHTKQIRDKKDPKKAVEEVETRPKETSDKDIAPPKAFPVSCCSNAIVMNGSLQKML